MNLDDLIERANEAAADEDYGTAYELWNRVQQEMAKEHPQINIERMNVALQSALCEARLGRAAAAMRTAEDAAIYFNDLALGDDNILHALFVLTDCAIVGGDLKRGKEASDRAMKMLRKHEYDSPRSLCTAVLWRSKLAMLMKDSALGDEAIEYGLGECKKMLKQGYDPQEMIFQQAQLYEQRGLARGSFDQLEAAAQDLENAITLYYKAWGDGDETADEARAALKRIRERPNKK